AAVHSRPTPSFAPSRQEEADRANQQDEPSAAVVAAEHATATAGFCVVRPVTRCAALATASCLATAGASRVTDAAREATAAKPVPRIRWPTLRRIPRVEELVDLGRVVDELDRG